MVKAIDDPAYRRLIGKLKQIRQVEVATRLGRSRKWMGKIETHDLRLDVLCFVRLCQAYGIKAGWLIREMEEEPSEDDGSFLGVIRFLFCQFRQFCFASFKNDPD